MKKSTRTCMYTTFEIKAVLNLLPLNKVSRMSCLHSKKSLCAQAAHFLHTMVYHKDGHSQITHVVSSLCTACILECTRVYELETMHNLGLVHKQCTACVCMQAFLAALSVQGPDPGGGGGDSNPPFGIFHHCALHTRGLYTYSIRPLSLFVSLMIV